MQRNSFGARAVWAKPTAFGAAASLLLLLVYLAVLSLLNSTAHAFGTFLELWFFMLPLVVGFGVQIALFVYIRNAHRHGLCPAASIAASAGVPAASGSVSTASMVACCLHHATDIAPFIGFTAAVVFVNKFQSFFLLLGIFSNALGALMMLRVIQNNSLYLEHQSFLSWLMSRNLRLTFRIVLVLALVSLAASVIAVA